MLCIIIFDVDIKKEISIKQNYGQGQKTLLAFLPDILLLSSVSQFYKTNERWTFVLMSCHCDLELTTERTLIILHRQRWFREMSWHFINRTNNNKQIWYNWLEIISVPKLNASEKINQLFCMFTATVPVYNITCSGSVDNW